MNPLGYTLRWLLFVRLTSTGSQYAGALLFYILYDSAVTIFTTLRTYWFSGIAFYNLSR